METGINKKILLHSTLFIIIVFLFSISTVYAQTPRANWDQASSTGEITLDNDSYFRVFQGERDITAWRNAGGADVTGTNMMGEAGRAEGEFFQLDRSISRDQPTGLYRHTGNNITASVQTPRITEVNVYNTFGVRIDEGGTIAENERILIEALWNFAEAEDIELKIEDPDGLAVQREALIDTPTTQHLNRIPSGFNNAFLDRESQGLGSTGFRRAYWVIDVSELRGGTHDLIIRGVEDLSFGDAEEVLSFRLEPTDELSVSVERTTVSQGERLRYTISGSSAGRYHAVSIHRDHLRSNGDPDRVFSLTGNSVEVGSTSTKSFAVLRVPESGRAIGQINTENLETGDIDIRLYRGAGSISGAKNELSNDDISSSSFDVERTRLSLNIDGFTYTPGQAIDVGGITSGGVDRIALYVRDRGDWELLPLNGRDTTRVGSNGRWLVRGVVLSDEDHGGRLLRFPGTYSIAVVDAADLSTPPPTALSSTELSRMSTSRSTIRSEAPVFFADFRTIRGQVASGDRLAFQGSSVGPDEIVVGFIGDRGDVSATTVRTNRGDLFDNIQLEIEEMRSSRITAIAVSPGRDRVFGDGSATDGDGDTVSIETNDEFVEYIDSFNNDRLTSTQIHDRIRSASIGRAGSDDFFKSTTFRVTSPNTRITDIVPSSLSNRSGVAPIESGEPMVVRGTTNRNPADTEIILDVIDGPDMDEFETAVIRSWDRGSGVWRATLNTEGISPGSYIIEVDDGDSTHNVAVEIIGEGQRGPDDIEDTIGLRERLADLRLTISDIRDNNTELREQLSELQQENENLSQRNQELRNQLSQPQPGFGFIAALIAGLISFVLIWRRSRET